MYLVCFVCDCTCIKMKDVKKRHSVSHGGTYVHHERAVSFHFTGIEAIDQTWLSYVYHLLYLKIPSCRIYLGTKQEQMHKNLHIHLCSKFCVTKQSRKKKLFLFNLSCPVTVACISFALHQWCLTYLPYCIT